MQIALSFEDFQCKTRLQTKEFFKQINYGVNVELFGTRKRLNKFQTG